MGGLGGRRGANRGVAKRGCGGQRASALRPPSGLIGDGCKRTWAAAGRGDAWDSAGPAPERGRSDGAGMAAVVLLHRCGCAPVSAVPGPALPRRPSAALCPLITGGWGRHAPGALANRETFLPGFTLACFFFSFFFFLLLSCRSAVTALVTAIPPPSHLGRQKARPLTHSCSREPRVAQMGQDACVSMKRY